MTTSYDVPIGLDSSRDGIGLPIGTLDIGAFLTGGSRVVGGSPRPGLGGKRPLNGGCPVAAHIPFLSFGTYHPHFAAVNGHLAFDDPGFGYRTTDITFDLGPCR